MNPTRPSDPGSDTGSSRYSFASRWTIDADRDRVWQVFDDLLATDDPFVWWPGLRTERRDGEDIHLVASSPVGYRLRFRLHDLESRPRDRVSLSSDGDLHGQATLVFGAVDDATSTLDVAWQVEVTKTWMRRGARVLRPVFVLAHDVVMARGERALNAWLSSS